MKKAKKIIAVLLAVTLVFGTITAFAASNAEPASYTSPDGNYTAYKMSHLGKGANDPDGLIDFESGDPDIGQNYAWSAVGYGDYMYIGTCYAAMWQTMKIIAVEKGMSIEQFRALINVAFNGTLYVGDPENNPTDVNRSIIAKVNMKTGETKILAGPDKSGGFRAATTFKDKLYFIGTGRQPILYEIDPGNNDKATLVYQADPITVPGLASGIRGLTEINGKLAMSMISDNGASIIASENPSLGKSSFKTIATQEDLFDYPANRYMDDIFGGSIWDMVSLNGKLYVSIVTGRENHKQSFALVCGEEQADGTFKFHVIAGDPEDGAKYPFGFGATRSGAGNLVVHDGKLYIGGYNDPMKALPAALSMDFELIFTDLSNPVNLWRMDENEKVEMVAGEANEVFPEGPVGNMGAGFDNPLNQYVWRMASYDGKLYVGTFDIGSLAYPVMQFTNGDLLRRSPEEWKTQLNYLKEFINLMKGGKVALPKAAGVNVAALANDVATVEKLYNKGGINDMASVEKFYNAMKNIYSVYSKVRPLLPAAITGSLDKILNEATINNIYYCLGTCKYLSKGVRGFDLLVSENGKDFEVITRDGFGSPYNHGLRTFAITNAGLCIGTANPFKGCQAWRLQDNTKDDTDPTDPTTPDGTDPTDPSGGNGAPADGDAKLPGDTNGDGKVDDADKNTDVNENAGTDDSENKNADTVSTGDVVIGLVAMAAAAGGAAIVISRKKRK